MPSPIEIQNFSYYQQSNSLFTEITVNNSYEISSSLPEPFPNTTEQPHTLLANQFISNQLINDFSSGLITEVQYNTIVSLLTDEKIKDLYLSTYSQLIDIFSYSGNKSVFFRDTLLTGSSAGLGEFTGLDFYKNANYFEILDLQQIKASTIAEVTSNPCFLINTSQNESIEPLKLAMLKTNFRILCRLLTMYLKLQNLFISSVFDNNEFYKSGNYKDSTFVDYCYDIFTQKIGARIPTYRNSIYVFLNEELKQKLSDGEELYDPISNQKIEFETPVTDENLEVNINKYAKYLFLQEFIFVSEKCNQFFTQQGTDNGYSFSVAPTTSFGTKLYTAKEYFLDSIPVAGLDGRAAPIGSGISLEEYTNIVSSINSNLPNSSRLYLEVLSNQTSSGYTLTLKLNMIVLSDFYKISTELASVSTSYVRAELTNEQLLRFMNNRLPELKAVMLSSENFNLITNYIFPLNKILNIASLTHINMLLKTYENVNSSIDGSMGTILNIHDIILGNQEKLDCERPELFIDDLTLGVNLQIAKALIAAPVQILKAIEETYDPNIAIASKLRKAAESLGAPKLPIIPYSLGLLPVFTVPPPVGVGPPLIPPWGYIYWGVDAAEIITQYAKNGFDNNKKTDFGLEATSQNPLKSNC
jgi:hypothetical protein